MCRKYLLQQYSDTGNCPNGWVSDSGGICYLQTNATNAWPAAEKVCEGLFDGSTLPVLCNSSEMDAFSNLTAYVKYFFSFFLCCTLQYVGSHFTLHVTITTGWDLMIQLEQAITIG